MQPARAHAGLALTFACLVMPAAGTLFHRPVRAVDRHQAMQQADDSLLVARERAMWKALESSDTAAFARLMGDGVVDADVSGIHRTTPASAAQFVANCATSNVALSAIHVVHRANSATVSYRATLTQSCWGQPAPSQLNVLTVYEHDHSWAPVAHSETPATMR